jgi:hypothetical protein
VGDGKERRQKGFLPDFRGAIKAARGARVTATNAGRPPEF